MAASCYIGKLLELEDECDTSSKINISDIQGTDLQLLSFRVKNFQADIEKEICSKHHSRFLEQYSYYYKKCCNPFDKHQKVVKHKLSILSLDKCLELKPLNNKNLIPGQKVCKRCSKVLNYHIMKINQCCDPFTLHRYPIHEHLIVLDDKICQDDLTGLSIQLLSGKKVCTRCFQKIQSDISESKNTNKSQSQNSITSDKPAAESNSSSLTETPLDSEESSGSTFYTASQEYQKLTNMLQSVGLPPLIRGKASDEKFVTKAVDSIQSVVDLFIYTINKAYDVSLPSINYKKVEEDADSFRNMIRNLQMRYNQESKLNKKIHLLTLLPDHWSYQDVSQYFTCSRYMWSSSKRIKESVGIIGEPSKRKLYSIIPDKIKLSITEYYYENSRMCSGIKESVKIKVPGAASIPVQKRLLLHDLKDLYEDWKKTTNFEAYPSFSYFALLRPQECVLAGSPGTHTICVCPLHQNCKLKLRAVECNLKTKDLIEKTVCSADNRACMFRICNTCSTEFKKKEIPQLLKDHIKVTETTSDITFSNWVQVTNTHEEGTSNKTVLQQFNEPFDKFLEKLAEDIWDLTVHHFISENQKNFLYNSKKELDLDTCIIMMDFAEKYAFIAQDATQGFYFNNSTATVHPIVMYYKDPVTLELKVQSFCVISNASKQTASTVNIFLEQVINVIKNEFSFIHKIIYFSDGCPTQYKNKNHLINICHHKKDFGLEVTSYNFFSTSHGKNACDGIGAVAKREARRASLQRTWKDHILDSEAMFNYLNTNVKQIRFFHVEEKSVQARDKKLKSRYANTKTIRDTRRNHCFIPINASTIKTKLYSIDDHYEIVEMDK